MHAGALAILTSLRAEPPRLDAFKTIEVTLVGGSAPAERPARRPPADDRRTGESAPRQASTGEIGAARGEETTVQARYDAAALENPKPPYPLAARRRGHEGRALLSARVRSDGACAEVVLKASSGYASLDAAALDTVRKWRFIPARRAGAAVDSWVEVPIVFRLEG